MSEREENNSKSEFPSGNFKVRNATKEELILRLRDLRGRSKNSEDKAEIEDFKKIIRTINEELAKREEKAEKKRREKIW